MLRNANGRSREREEALGVDPGGAIGQSGEAAELDRADPAPVVPTRLHEWMLFADRQGADLLPLAVRLVGAADSGCSRQAIDGWKRRSFSSTARPRPRTPTINRVFPYFSVAFPGPLRPSDDGTHGLFEPDDVLEGSFGG